VLKPNGRYRRFTPREAARIQSFPDTFTLTGVDGRQYRAIGNAVPPVLMWYAAKSVIAALSKVPNEIQSGDSIRTTLYMKADDSVTATFTLPQAVCQENTEVVLKKQPACNNEKCDNVRIGEMISIDLSAPSERRYAYFPLNKNNRRFFPGYKEDFILETDVGTVKTHVTSAKAGTKKGDRQAGAIIQGGLKAWYCRYPNLPRIICFECILPYKKYYLTVL
jgi:hypothetical protein